MVACERNDTRQVARLDASLCCQPHSMQPVCSSSSNKTAQQNAMRSDVMIDLLLLLCCRYVFAPIHSVSRAQAQAQAQTSK